MNYEPTKFPGLYERNGKTYARVKDINGRVVWYNIKQNLIDRRRARGNLSTEPPTDAEQHLMCEVVTLIANLMHGNYVPNVPSNE